ncbi:MAG TPA: HNH endonuclease [Rhizomicrobium sp.]|nr:HNH endonuclease [Rhizomicrobium sp.]
MERRNWTREELLQTLELYCVTPFGRMHSGNPNIKRLALAIGRTPSAVALKMTNFASLDPTLAQSGMSNASKLDRIVWDEFFEDMLSSMRVGPPTDRSGLEESARDFVTETRAFPEGIDIVRSVKTRLNQSFFRRLVLASYDNKCALTGIDAPELLVASHIVPWATNKEIRTTPQNGICLNALHDRAFDEGYIAFDEDLSVIYSARLPMVAKAALKSLGSSKLRLPSRFVPDSSLIAFHRHHIFKSG